jgi:antitoxin CcdA
MRQALYDVRAKKQTVSLTINSDLHAKAKARGINASRVAEEALSRELERIEREAVREEIHREVEAYNDFVEEHGSFAALVRGHYGAV